MSLPGNDDTFHSDVVAAVADVVILVRNCYSADVEQRETVMLALKIK